MGGGLRALLSCLLVLGSQCASRSVERAAVDLDHVSRWWIFLGHADDPGSMDWSAATRTTELVILSDDPRIPLRAIHPRTVRLAYLSVGEAESGRTYWRSIQRRSFLVEENPDWPGNIRVDIRDRRWQDVLLNTEAPRLLGMGFQGFMLDTIETAPYLEAKDPVRFAGARQALRELLAAFRHSFPGAIILVNGTEALVDAAPFVDGYVTESLFATHDAAAENGGGYRPTTAEERSWRLAQVDRALARARRPVFTVEYAADGGGDGNGREPGAPGRLAAWAAGMARRRGFKPFITVRAINRLPASPLAPAATPP